jgi:nucleoside-diphosphate-sugar epimerase
MKILITGGSGFIGTNLLEFYLKKKYTVLNIDCSEPVNKIQSPYWQNLDIRDYDSLKKSVLDFNPDYIVHLAARTDLNGKNLSEYSTNTTGVENILKIVNQYLPNLRKIIITSSMLVCCPGFYPKTSTDYHPATIYGESKVKTEKIIWNNPPVCDWCIIRPTSIWGPWFGIPYRNFFDMVIAKRYFHIGHKSSTKTYGYIGNAIYQIDKILFTETSDINNKVFYIGDSPATNIEKWSNEIANELNCKIKRIPYFLIKIVALFGDFLKFFTIHFPMNSFRLKNMTTNNIIDLTNTYNIAPNPPFSRIEGIKRTLEWINKYNNGI